MKYLSVDTATRVESVALNEDDQLIVEHSILRKSGHGAGILDDVEDLLGQAGWTLEDVDAYVCGLGPGSFTGLRIGLATLKGLAMAMDKPLLGARTTHLLRAAMPDAKTIAVIDARRGQIYAEGDGLKEPVCCNPDVLWEHVTPTQGLVLIGDGAVQYRDVLLAGTTGVVIPEDETIHQPRAALLPGLVSTEEAAALAVVEPVYVRKSDAEINYPDGFPDAAARPPKLSS